MVKDFETIYIASRQKEGRLYTNEQLRQLPVVDATHPHYAEWLLRKRSADHLCSYLQQKNRPLSILEVGCGNGWLSNRLSAIQGSTIIGSDINNTELEQAQQVFTKANIRFVPATIGSPYFIDKKFDAIIFAASIQYFSGFAATMRVALSMLLPAGEIHITDSYFYKADAVDAAKKRSLLHYESAGHPAMANFYFHHTIDMLQEFNHVFLFNPGRLLNKFFYKTMLFPWISITQ